MTEARHDPKREQQDSADGAKGLHGEPLLAAGERKGDRVEDEEIATKEQVVGLAGRRDEGRQIATKQREDGDGPGVIAQSQGAGGRGGHQCSGKRRALRH